MVLLNKELSFFLLAPALERRVVGPLRALARPRPGEGRIQADPGLAQAQPFDTQEPGFLHPFQSD